MPSSKDRQRVEVPVYLYEQLARIAETEDRTITSVLHQLLFQALQTYQPTWLPSKHLSRFNKPAQHVLAWPARRRSPSSTRLSGPSTSCSGCCANKRASRPWLSKN